MMDDILSGYEEPNNGSDGPEDTENEELEDLETEPTKKVYRNRYNWNIYLTEFLAGHGDTLAEYIDYNEARRRMGEKRPSEASIREKAKNDKWIKLKHKVQNKTINNIVKGASKITRDVRGRIEEHVDMQDELTRTLIKLINKLQENPEHLSIRADLSDLVNDARRGIGGRTKEEDLRPSNLTIGRNEGIVEIDSRRKELEEASEDKQALIAKKQESFNKNMRNNLKFTDEVEVEAEVVEEDEE